MVILKIISLSFTAFKPKKDNTFHVTIYWCAKKKSISMCVFPSVSPPFHPAMSVDVTYGWPQTSHHNAPHTCQCPTPLQLKRSKNTETSQQCINNTGFTTVWPSEHTQTGCLLQRNVMGFLWDVCFRLFRRCSLGRRCHKDKRQFNKNVSKNGF